MTREEFIQRSRDSEYRFMSADGQGTMISFLVGPWVCDCGHKERSAGKAYDHAIACGSEPTQGELFA